MVMVWTPAQSTESLFCGALGKISVPFTFLFQFDLCTIPCNSTWFCTHAIVSWLDFAECPGFVCNYSACVWFCNLFYGESLHIYKQMGSTSISNLEQACKTILSPTSLIPIADFCQLLIMSWLCIGPANRFWGWLARRWYGHTPNLTGSFYIKSMRMCLWWEAGRNESGSKIFRLPAAEQS